MDRNEKKLIRYAVVIPVASAICITILFCVLMSRVDFPYTQGSENLADYQYEEIKEPSDSYSGDYSGSGEEADKTEILACIDDNTIIGSINISNNNYSLIYNANEVNANSKFNIENDVLIGEVGVCRAQIYKDESTMLKLLSEGETVTVETFYSDYEYEVTETLTVSGYSELLHCGEGVGRALVLYTDNSLDNGISDEYFVCICKMVSGINVG